VSQLVQILAFRLQVRQAKLHALQINVPSSKYPAIQTQLEFISILLSLTSQPVHELLYDDVHDEQA
jgi:hypothetical protein